MKHCIVLLAILVVATIEFTSAAAPRRGVVPPHRVAFLGGLGNAKKTPPHKKNSKKKQNTEEVTNISRGGTKTGQVKAEFEEMEEEEDNSVVMGGGEGSFFYF